MDHQVAAARLSAADAKARLLEEDPMKGGADGFRQLVKDHPLAATGIALAAGLVLAKSRAARSMAVPALMMLAKKLF
jgi:hypothetical protein